MSTMRAGDVHASVELNGPGAQCKSWPAYLPLCLRPVNVSVMPPHAAASDVAKFVINYDRRYMFCWLKSARPVH